MEVVENKKIDCVKYMEWLDNFTNIYKNFEDDSYLYVGDPNLNGEFGNALKLGYFYKSIDRVLKNEDIYPLENSYQTYYFINYQDKCYQIGYMEGQEIVYFCNVVEEGNLQAIDFSKIEEGFGRQKKLFLKGI